MTLVKRNGSLLNPLPTLFDDFFNRDLLNWNNSNFSNTNTTIPAVNIKETAENYEVEVAAPGMTKEDFKVELDGNLLTISSERAIKKKKEKMKGIPARNLVINLFKELLLYKKDVVDIDKIQAKYENGLLHLLIPKKRKQNKNHQD